MQILQEIIGLAYFHFYPTMEAFLPPGTKNQQLYRAIRDGEVTTDEEARQLIYGDRRASKKYTMLKQRLRQQVTDHYFLLLSQLDHGTASPLRQRIDYLKQLTIVHTLMEQGRYPLARQLLRYQQKAAAAQFDLLAVQEGLQLLRRMAGYQGERAAFRRYDAQLQRVSQQAHHLRDARGYYEAVRMEHRRHWPPSASVAKLAHDYATAAPSDRQPAVSFYTYLLRLLAAFHRGDVAAFRRTLSLQKQLVRRHPGLVTYDPVAHADLLTLEYLSTQHPADQSRVVQQGIQGSRDESLPVTAWLALREVECMHWLRTEQYERAERVAEQLVDDEHLTASPHDRARWALFLAYATYLSHHPPPPSEATPSLAEWERPLQPLLTDAAGYGWQWTLLKMLLWLERPFLPPRPFLSQLDAYAQRHRARQSERSVDFFRHLRAVIAARRDQKQLTYRAKDLKLPQPSVGDGWRELVPYETLWRAVVTPGG